MTPEPTPNETEVADLTYAAAAAELEAILQRLDRDAVDVDDLARQVRRAADLISHCRARITLARTEVERVAAELEDLVADAEPVGGSEPDLADEADEETA